MLINQSALLTAGLCLLLASCGSETATAPETEEIVVSPGDLTLLVGSSQHLVATDEAGNILSGPSVSWTTSAPAVATVSSTGFASAVGVGSATIGVTVEGMSGTATISVVGSLAFASVVTGGAHTCALTSAGAAYCWGRGESGQLGVSASAPESCPTDAGELPCSKIPVPVAGGLTFGQLSGGSAHTCGLTSDGSAYCWGNNLFGQLGDNSITNRNAPVAVSTGLKFASLDAGAGQTCALTSSGTAYCWGANRRGELGDGTTTDRTVPVRVTGNFSFELIVTGGTLSISEDIFAAGHTCGLTSAGAAYCWGQGVTGQLGTGPGDFEPHPVPALVSGAITFQSLTAGLGSHTCGLTSAGSAYCWGGNPLGALGDGTDVSRSTPVEVVGELSFAQIAAGGFFGHTCAVTSSGKAYCWGDNERGMVGDGTTDIRLVPTSVVGDHVFTSLDAGQRHTCGRSSTGTLYCWGSNGGGQLGLNSTVESTRPAKVIGQP